MMRGGLRIHSAVATVLAVGTSAGPSIFFVPIVVVTERPPGPPFVRTRDRFAQVTSSEADRVRAGIRIVVAAVLRATAAQERTGQENCRAEQGQSQHGPFPW
jgi:hypothetical protein